MNKFITLFEFKITAIPSVLYLEGSIISRIGLKKKSVYLNLIFKYAPSF